MRFLSKWAKSLSGFRGDCRVVFCSSDRPSRAWTTIERWHTYFPYEMSAKELDRTDWPKYLSAEAKAFDAVGAEITQKLAPEDRIPINRYFDGSPVYPPHLPNDWNRSHVLEPNGTPIGAAVFLHGPTDSPYSLRHIARRYRDHGFVAIAIRPPAHGITPAALTSVKWEDCRSRPASRCGRRPLSILGSEPSSMRSTTQMAPNPRPPGMPVFCDPIGDEQTEGDGDDDRADRLAGHAAHDEVAQPT